MRSFSSALLAYRTCLVPPGRRHDPVFHFSPAESLRERLADRSPIFSLPSRHPNSSVRRLRRLAKLVDHRVRNHRGDVGKFDRAIRLVMIRAGRLRMRFAPIRAIDRGQQRLPRAPNPAGQASSPGRDYDCRPGNGVIFLPTGSSSACVGGRGARGGETALHPPALFPTSPPRTTCSGAASPRGSPGSHRNLGRHYDTIRLTAA